MQQNAPALRLDRRRLLALMPATAGAALLPGLARAVAAADPVQALVDDFVASGKAPGVSVAVIRDGNTRFYNAGVFSHTTHAPATEHSVHEIGSISKTFTSLLLAHAIEEGRARIDDDVRRHLPPGYDNLVRDGRPIRLADLVTTTSALQDNLPDWSGFLGKVPEDQVVAEASKLLKGYDPANFLPDLKTVTLLDVPGRTPRHSNTASQLQGVLAERIYGEPYDALLARLVERPLGMRAGGGAVPPGLLVTGYSSKGAEAPPLDMPLIRAAGGLRYSAVDLARYVAAQLAARDPAIARTHRPLFGTPETSAIGFHWVIAKTADSQLYLRHSGGTFGQSSYCDFYPAQRYGAVVLANSAGAQNTGQALADTIHAALFGPPHGLKALEAELERSNYGDVSATIAATKARFPELHLTEDYMNAWGYRLLRASPRAARGIFAWNAAQFPESWNTHDSLAEAIAATGDKAGAIMEYRRSLALNPANDNATQMIAKLQKAP
ncbi:MULTISPECIES: serine hydrolase domain-containing protein [unclassified Sphingomonas]|jgi:serine-type D-Ala-D-Ala carboxypeptidase/endopeptidase|uniref:serine hydrolase domain-containing protein n=5 Tax=Pseudomonadota TaxID=1224 RepID=UPI0010F7546F|nr:MULTISPECIES: serine hydrolase domain-containing protein [unclassified Sphingomonas]